MAPQDLSTLTRPSAPATTAASTPIPRPPSRWKSRLLVPGVILLSAAALLLYTARDALRPAIPVTVVPVVERDVGAAGAGAAGAPAQVITQAAGWIEPDPFPINVSALTDGIVRDLLVLEGDRVEAGQVIAHLIDDDAKLALAATEAEVAQRTAEVAIAGAQTDAAQADWDNPIERTRAVAAARAGAAEARAELAKLPADLAAEEARLAELRDELDRKAALIQTGAVSRGELARLESRLAAQTAALGSLVATQPILEARAESAEAALTAAAGALRLRIPETLALAAAHGAADQARAALARAEAARDEARLRLERTAIRSPIAGVVLSRLAAPGTRLMPGGGEAGLGEAVRGDSPTSGGYAVRLYDPARLQVRVDIPLADAGRLSIDQDAELTVEVLPNRTLRGRITRILGEANVQKNTLQVKVAIDDPPAALRPEMLARVRFLGQASGGAGGGERGAGEGGAGALFVPAAALVNREGASAQVWTAQRRPGGAVAALRPITLGASTHDGWLQTTAGLNHGDLIITTDRDRLREGARIRITGN